MWQKENKVSLWIRYPNLFYSIHSVCNKCRWFSLNLDSFELNRKRLFQI
jgi:hypothetical protein